MDNIITVNNVYKKFKTYETSGGILKSLFSRKKLIKTALDDVSFTVKSGEIIALLGRNGSGKSTLIKMMVGILHPDSGSIRVLSLDPYKDRIKLVQQIGVVVGSTHPQLYWDLPPIDTFEYVKGMYGISDNDFEKRLEYFMNMLSLKDVYKRQTRQLSLGERMKCEFVAANLHAPKIVFMDEPTVGVDLPSRMAIAKSVMLMRKQFGTTFIITTHVVDDITNSDRIIMLDHGKLIFNGSQDKLRKMFKKRVMLELYLSNSANRNIYTKHGKVIVSRDNFIKLEINPKVVKEEWFMRMLSSKGVIDYRLTEPNLSFLLNEIYSSIDKKLKKRGAKDV